MHLRYFVDMLIALQRRRSVEHDRTEQGFGLAPDRSSCP